MYIKGREPVPVIAQLRGSKLGTMYSSMTICARELNVQLSHISECCSGKRKQHKGYTFKYYKENNDEKN